MIGKFEGTRKICSNYTIIRIIGVSIYDRENLRRPENLFELHDYSNYRSLDYMSSTVFARDLKRMLRNPMPYHVLSLIFQLF